KPGVVRVYDYYDPENEAKVMYNIRTQDCYADKLEMCPKCITLSKDNIDELAKYVTCNSTVSRVKVDFGKIKVGKNYMNTNTVKQVYLSYVIPDYCPCEQIYNDLKSLVIGNSYVKMMSGKKTIVLGAGTTIIQWKEKTIKKQMKDKLKQMLKECK
ncbi:hypothetical protein, partial [Salmonella sp. s54412]|uniref:hypothetical protein n=1 Tax=Salmonella sp. s54412 TaxID=3160128 RepID=UPI003754A093